MDEAGYEIWKEGSPVLVKEIHKKTNATVRDRLKMYSVKRKIITQNLRLFVLYFLCLLKHISNKW